MDHPARARGRELCERQLKAFRGLNRVLSRFVAQRPAVQDGPGQGNEKSSDRKPAAQCGDPARKSHQADRQNDIHRERKAKAENVSAASMPRQPAGSRRRGHGSYGRCARARAARRGQIVFAGLAVDLTAAAEPCACGRAEARSRSPGLCAKITCCFCIGACCSRSPNDTE